MDVGQLRKLPLDKYQAWLDWYYRRRVAPDALLMTVGLLSRNVAMALGGKGAPKKIEDYVIPALPGKSKRPGMIDIGDETEPGEILGAFG